MDVQRIENVAIPTAAAAVIGGATGYVTKKAFTKDGHMTRDLFYDMKDSFESINKNLIKKSDYLKELAELSDTEAIAKRAQEIGMAAMTPDERAKAVMMAFEKSKNGEKAVIELTGKGEKAANKYIADASKANNKKLYKFVKKNFDMLDIEILDKESKKDAIKRYLANRDVNAVKADFDAAIRRSDIEKMNVKKFIRTTFNDVYDKEAKGFKNGDEYKEIVSGFKRAARNLKLKQAGLFAGIASGIALVSSVITDQLANR